MSQEEDDLRGLAKVMDFMRAISIVFMLVHCYWFCYGALNEAGLTLDMIDKILMNFQKNTGLFSSILWTKFFIVLFLGLSCFGTRGVKNENITWRKISTVLASGAILFFFNPFLLKIPHGAFLYVS